MTTIELTVVSYNLGNRPGETAADLDALAALQPAIIACQEGRDREQKLTAWLLRSGHYEAVPFVGAGVADTPILYDSTRLELRDHDAILVAGSTHVGDGKAHSGAGPDTLNPKSICRAVFRDRVGHRRITVLNEHLPASWTRSADYLGEVEYKRRRAYGSRQVQLTVDAVSEVNRGLVLVTGDFNAPATFPLMRPLSEVVDLGDTGPTHSGAHPIDFIGVGEHQAITGVGRVVLKPLSSDHRPLAATVRYTSRTPTGKATS